MGQPLTIARYLLLFLAIVNVYRAATQSLTTDEAFTYNRSVAVPIPQLWEIYDANDHVLHTLLCKLTTQWFGVSEFTLRIPSLLGGFLFLWLALRLSRDAFGNGRKMLLSVALIALNPLTLDYCSIARGYGMAMSLFLAAFWLLWREAWHGPSRWRLMTSGVLMALAVAANLTVLVPCTALVLVFSGLRLLPAARQRDWSQVRRRAERIVDHVLVPFLVIAVALLLMPLLPADRNNFYVGARDTATSLLSFGQGIFWRPDPAFLGTVLHEAIRPAMAKGMGWGVFPLLLITACSAALIKGWRWLRAGAALEREDQMVVTGGLVLLGCLAAFAMVHWGYGVPYPYRRTGLYLMPLVTLLAVAQWGGVSSSRAWHKAGIALAAVTLLSFASSFNVRFYDEWILDAGTKDIMRRVAAMRPKDGSKRRLATSSYLDHTARFYARLYRLDWVETPPVPAEILATGDIYLLTLGDRRVIQQRRLEVQYEHPVSAVALAVAPK